MRESSASIEPLLRKLEQFATLSTMDKNELGLLAEDAHHAPAGVDLVREGDRPSGVILVLQGCACRYTMRQSGKRAILGYLLPGDCCDLDVALLPRMDHSIATLSSSLVVRIKTRTIQRLLQAPTLARALRTSCLVDEAIMREWLVNLSRRKAVERLAHLLCELHARLQVVGLVEHDGFDLPITQEKLADTIGLTAVQVNRTLQHLRRSGLISLQKGRLTILDPASLQTIGDFRSDYLHGGEHQGRQGSARMA